MSLLATFGGSAMSTTVTPLPLPAVSPEVAAFAAEQGVSEFLTPVLEMTRRVFPAAPLAPRVESDPDVADRYIVIEVDVSDWEERPLFAAQQSWTGELFSHCPAPHVHFFRLGMVAFS
jgi:hypothetical protein